MSNRNPWKKDPNGDYISEWRTWELSIYQSICEVDYGWSANRQANTKTKTYKTGNIERFHDATGFKNAALALADFRAFAGRMGWKLPKYLWQLPLEEKPKDKKKPVYNTVA